MRSLAAAIAVIGLSTTLPLSASPAVAPASCPAPPLLFRGVTYRPAPLSEFTLQQAARPFARGSLVVTPCDDTGPPCPIGEACPPPPPPPPPRLQPTRVARLAGVDARSAVAVRVAAAYLVYVAADRCTETRGEPGLVGCIRFPRFPTHDKPPAWISAQFAELQLAWRSVCWRSGRRTRCVRATRPKPPVFYVEPGGFVSLRVASGNPRLSLRLLGTIRREYALPLARPVAPVPGIAERYRVSWPVPRGFRLPARGVLAVLRGPGLGGPGTVEYLVRLRPRPSRQPPQSVVSTSGREVALAAGNFCLPQCIYAPPPSERQDLPALAVRAGEKLRFALGFDPLFVVLTFLTANDEVAETIELARVREPEWTISTSHAPAAEGRIVVLQTAFQGSSSTTYVFRLVPA